MATKTRMIVDAAHAANPSCEILTTRKSMPGVKDLLVVATIAGGAVNPGNAGEYAATGVDGLATTAPFTAKPIDMSVRMRRLG